MPRWKIYDQTIKPGKQLSSVNFQFPISQPSPFSSPSIQCGELSASCSKAGTCNTPRPSMLSNKNLKPLQDRKKWRLNLVVPVRRIVHNNRFFVTICVLVTISHKEITIPERLSLIQLWHRKWILIYFNKLLLLPPVLYFQMIRSLVSLQVFLVFHLGLRCLDLFSRKWKTCHPHIALACLIIWLCCVSDGLVRPSALSWRW